MWRRVFGRVVPHASEDCNVLNFRVKQYKNRHSLGPLEAEKELNTIVRKRGDHFHSDKHHIPEYANLQDSDPHSDVVTESLDVVHIICLIGLNRNKLVISTHIWCTLIFCCQYSCTARLTSTVCTSSRNTTDCVPRCKSVPAHQCAYLQLTAGIDKHYTARCSKQNRHNNWQVDCFHSIQNIGFIDWSLFPIK